MRSTLYLFPAVIVALSLSAGEATAAIISGSSVGLSSPGTVITFDENVLPAQTPVTNQYAPFGVTFSPFARYDEVGATGIPNIAGHYVANFIANVGANADERIKFNSPVTAAAFAIGTQTGTTTFTAYLAGLPVLGASFSAATNLTSANNYFGFQSIFFDEIGFTVVSSDRAAVFDNIKFTRPSAVPEPSVSALMAVALAGVLLTRRRRVGRS